jgi:hypothetical protein
MLTMWDVRVMRKVLRKQVEKKFGPLTPEQVRRVESVHFSKLEEKLEVVVTAGTFAELGLPEPKPDASAADAE